MPFSFFSLLTAWRVLLGVAAAMTLHDVLAFYGLAYSAIVLGHELHWPVNGPVDILRIGMMPAAGVIAWWSIRARGGFARYGWAVPCGIGAAYFVYEMVQGIVTVQHS